MKIFKRIEEGDKLSHVLVGYRVSRRDCKFFLNAPGIVGTHSEYSLTA